MSIKYVTRRAEDKKWCVKNAKASKATRVFNTQKEAIQYATSLKSTTSIMVQSKEGKFRKHSTWDGVKKQEETKTMTTKKPVAKKATPAKKTSVVEKVAPFKQATVAEKPIIKSELTQEQIDIKERVIQELKTQNNALDKQLAKEEAEKAIVEQETKKLEKPIAKKESGKKSNKIILALGITFLLVVIIVGLLFFADWKNLSWAAFDINNKK